jgi:hypothetical protein
VKASYSNEQKKTRKTEIGDQSLRCWILDAGHWILDPGRWMPKE